MNCLLCGQKLAIFRRLSLGDFCSQEHRALFLREQSDQGLARLIESKAERPQTRIATRVYAQFLPDEMSAQGREAGFRSHGPVAHAKLIAPEPPQRSFSQLAPARVLSVAKPAIGVMSPVCCEFVKPGAMLPPKLAPASAGQARLSQAGLILPWAGVARSSSTFSLAPLVAAAWAQSGPAQLRPPEAKWIGKMQFVWPGIAGAIEALTPPTEELPTAAFAEVQAPTIQPMRVRLSVPQVAPKRPKLAMPAPAPIEEDVRALIARAAAAQERKPGLFDALFAPKPATIRLRRDLKRKPREEVFNYNEPAPVVAPSRGSWADIFAGLAPRAGLLSAAFAMLFIISAVGIVFSLSSGVSRSGSFDLSSLKTAIRNRAVLRVEDDFRDGLNRWIGPSGWSKDWSLDTAGFLRPGKLGFLEQSMSLTNYRMEFMGQIEKKSLGWAFRAKDEKNYYVAKLTVSRPGPLPMVDLIRYAVTNGKEGSKTRVSLPFSVRTDTLYQVEMKVLGDQFRATVNGHIVDSWSDNRLRAGGVGFVSGQGESALVRWIRVSDRDDLLGRFCSYLSARYQATDDGVLSASYFTVLRPVSIP